MPGMRSSRGQEVPAAGHRLCSTPRASIPARGESREDAAHLGMVLLEHISVPQNNGLCVQTLTLLSPDSQSKSLCAHLSAPSPCAVTSRDASSGTSSKLHPGLIKKEKKECKKASENVLEGFLGVAPRCLSGARQQLTSSKWIGHRCQMLGSFSLCHSALPAR